MPNLNKETAAIWAAWSRMGNREVTREAVAKGTHVDLAIKFLSSRNEMSLMDAQTWFRNEVLLWVKELMNRKQIHRSKHILKNAGFEPLTELRNIFYKTESNNSRKCIGDHLIEMDSMDEDLRSLWVFLDIIHKNHNSVNISDCDTLEDLYNKGSEWHSKTATSLFFVSYDNHLMVFIKSIDMFEYLLLQKKELLQYWIDVYFGHHHSCIIECHANLKTFFENNDITEEMMHLVYSSYLNVLNSVGEEILNKFCEYGIFIKHEMTDLIKFLSRVLEYDITKIYDILQMETSTVQITQFVGMLENFCVKHDMLFILGTCCKYMPLDELKNSISPHIDILKQLKSLSWTSIDSLRENIFKTVEYIKDSDYEDYFKKNPIVLCSLLLFTKDVTFLETFKSRVSIGEFEVSKYANIILSEYNIVRSVINQSYRENNYIFKDRPHYDLIKKHLKINVKRVFEHRFSNIELPHFNCDRLVQRYGLREKLDYIFYIRELMPSIAARLVEEELSLSEGNTRNQFSQKFVEETLRTAIKNFENVELSCSCISFLEMINVPSNKLRILLRVAETLYKAGWNPNYCKTMLVEVENTAYEIQNILEDELVKNIKFGFGSGKDFIHATNQYDLVMQFSQVNNLKLPEQFLKNCAMKNDWLYFLIFAQVQNYPVDEIREICQFFKDPSLLEHILHSVTYSIELEQEENSMRRRDTRLALLSKIGVRRSIQQKSTAEPDDAFDSTYEDYPTLEIDSWSPKTTLLKILIQCHNSGDPPRALLQACHLYTYPPLAILATFYEPDSVHTSWLTWLVVSCEFHQIYDDLETIVMLAGNTMQILNKAMVEGFLQTLLKSFQIFFPESSLRHFLEFLNYSMPAIAMDRDIMFQELKAFLKNLRNCKSSNILYELDHEITYLMNRNWIEETSLVLMASALQHNCKSIWEQILLMRAICDLDFQNIFVTDVPDFISILNLLTLLFDSDTVIRIDLPRIFNNAQHREAIVKCINDLLDEKLFETALKVAEIGKLPRDLVILTQWKDKFIDTPGNYLDFFKCCNLAFKDHNVTADRVIEFYSTVSEKINNESEIYEVSKYSFQWARDYNLSTQYELEKDMWLNYLKLKDKKLDSLDINHEIHLYQDMLEILDKVPIASLSLPCDSDITLKELISLSLERGNLFLALRLEKMFSCENSELDILKLCCSLAEGLQMPHHLTASERMLLNKISGIRYRSTSSRRLLLPSRFSGMSFSSYSPSISSLTNNETTLESPGQDVLSIIQTLSERLVKGSEIATTVLMAYRVSLNIQVPYHVVLCNSDVSILKAALEMDCPNKLEVLNDFTLIHKWNKEQIADLVCEEIITHIRHHIKSKSGSPVMWDLSLDTEFNYILRLFQNECSILGSKIISQASNHFVSCANTELDKKELSFIVELLIRAHDCFTSDCNIEGMSTVLHKCQSIIMELLALKNWKLIVRLLTGIARYSEMKYVFDLLKENDQFEYLLRKGSRQDNMLKLALMTYIKKYCPENKELYKMVALHFAMFSEVAILWENDAAKIVKNLVEISKLEMQNNKINPDTEPYVILTNTDGTRLCLSKAMENYTYATEFYLQGEKLTKAMHTARQAELLAVQLSLFNGSLTSETAVCILDLEDSQLKNLMLSQLCFEQSLILVEAYKYTVDWASVLFSQCILQDNITYLENFLNHLPLTEDIIRNISRQFISNFGIITKAGVSNMKLLLSKLPSVHSKYQIASELGFNDIIEDLLNTGQLCYLKDTVWKRGYKNSS